MLNSVLISQEQLHISHAECDKGQLFVTDGPMVEKEKCW